MKRLDKKSSHDAKAFRHLRVLVVEDHQDVAANISDFLEENGHVVDFAMDGITGLHLSVTQTSDGIVAYHEGVIVSDPMARKLVYTTDDKKTIVLDHIDGGAADIGLDHNNKVIFAPIIYGDKIVAYRIKEKESYRYRSRLILQISFFKLIVHFALAFCHFLVIIVPLRNVPFWILFCL